MNYLTGMISSRILLPPLVCLAVIAVGFIAVSLFDLLIAVWYARFYTTAAFIVTFGVGGIFTGIFAYSGGLSMVKQPTDSSRWWIAGFIAFTGLLWMSILAKLEGGEYEAAFRSFGITLAPAALLAAKWDFK